MANDIHATIEEREGVITVVMDRPEKLNAISPQMTETYWEAVRQMSTRNDLRCMVITAKGKYFSAGIDLNAPNKREFHPDQAHPGWNYRRDYRLHHLLYDEMENLEKPIIMAVQGICLGAGVEMAMSCDFRFCTPRAEFALPEVDLGLSPGSGGVNRLTRLLGPSWGKWIAMAGMRVAAEQAKTIGLVHDVFQEETFMDDVYAFCDRLITIPADALGLAKLTVDMAADLDRVGGRHLSRLANTTLKATPEHLERTARFKK